MLPAAAQCIGRAGSAGSGSAREARGGLQRQPSAAQRTGSSHGGAHAVGRRTPLCPQHAGGTPLRRPIVRMHIALAWPRYLHAHFNPCALSTVQGCQSSHDTEKRALLHISFHSCMPSATARNECTQLTAYISTLQDIQVSSRLLDKLQRKVEAAAGANDWAAYFQHVSEAILAFSAAARQATVLRSLEQSPGAQLLLQELEDACLRVDATRNSLYSSLLTALQQRLDTVSAPHPA